MAILHFQRHLFHPVQNLLFLNVLSFIYLASNAFSGVGSVGRFEKKTKKNHKKSRNRRSWYPRMTLKIWINKMPNIR